MLKYIEKERSEMNKKAISEVTIRDVVEDMAPPPPKVPTNNKVVEDMSKKDEGKKLNATPINIDINANNKKQEDEEDNRRHRKRSFCFCC